MIPINSIIPTKQHAQALVTRTLVALFIKVLIHLLVISSGVGIDIGTVCLGYKLLLEGDVPRDLTLGSWFGRSDGDLIDRVAQGGHVHRVFFVSRHFGLRKLVDLDEDGFVEWLVSSWYVVFAGVVFCLSAGRTLASRIGDFYIGYLIIQAVPWSTMEFIDVLTIFFDASNVF